MFAVRFLNTEILDKLCKTLNRWRETSTENSKPRDGPIINCCSWRVKAGIPRTVQWKESTGKTKCAVSGEPNTAQSVVLQIAEAFCRVATRACTRSSHRFVSRKLTGGQPIPGQHTNCFHISRILSNAVPLGFWFGGFSSTAGYAPATKLNFR